MLHNEDLNNCISPVNDRTVFECKVCLGPRGPEHRSDYLGDIVRARLIVWFYQIICILLPSNKRPIDDEC